MAREQDKTYDTDRLETTVPAAGEPLDGAGGFPVEAPTSARDAGLDDELLEEDGTVMEALPDEDLNASDGDFEDETPNMVEIPMSDLPGTYNGLGAPEMADLNVPGEVDIEELDEHALDLTDLPADARLDPLEE